MSSRNRDWPVGFRGFVGIISCAIGLGVVYFGYGVGTESPKKNAAAAPPPAAQAPDRKRPVRTMNMALGNMVFFARDLGFEIKGKHNNVEGTKIGARIEGQLQEIRELYRREVVNNPALAGTITLRFNVAPSGEVTQVRELSSRLNDDEFKRAVITVASNWSFADIIDEHSEVTCPLLFVHEGMDITTLVLWEKFLEHGEPEAILPSSGDNTTPARPGAAARSAAPPISDAKVLQIKYATALRKEPTFSSASLATLTVGTKISVLQRQGDWLEVQSAVNGPIGFIRKEFVAAVAVARK